MTKAWVKARKRDPYYRAAKRREYRSRAAFKLLQIQNRFRLIRAGDTVVDLGASPGGWTQVAAELVRPGGRVLAVDRVGLRPLSGVAFVRGDVSEDATRVRILEILGRPADVVLSDMAPRLSGSRPYDQARVLELAGIALDLAAHALRRGGNLAVKAFEGEGYRTFLDEVGRGFDRARGFRPPATTKTSRETYVIGLGRR